jgi:hypothetical protein
MTNNVVPKIIWQTHEEEYQNLPQSFLAASMTWKNLNPNWKYRYVSAENREKEIKNFDPTLYEYYTILNKINQADVWGYVVTYKYGGFYADMDSACTMPLDYFLETKWHGEEVIITSPGFQTLPDTVNISNFGAIKKSNVLRQVLSGIVRLYTKNLNREYINIIKSKSYPIEYEQSIWYMMTYVLKQYNIDVCYELENASLHSSDLKDSFDMNLVVNYFGKIKKYSELAAKKNWTTHIEFSMSN